MNAGATTLFAFPAALYSPPPHSSFRTHSCVVLLSRVSLLLLLLLREYITFCFVLYLPVSTYSGFAYTYIPIHTMQFTSDQVKEVSSWIHDERKCVSIGAIQANMGLTRSQAQAVLRQVPADALGSTTNNNSYQVTNCVVSEEEEEVEQADEGEEEAVKCTGNPYVLILICL